MWNSIQGTNSSALAGGKFRCDQHCCCSKCNFYFYHWFAFVFVISYSSVYKFLVYFILFYFSFLFQHRLCLSFNSCITLELFFLVFFYTYLCVFYLCSIHKTATAFWHAVRLCVGKAKYIFCRSAIIFLYRKKNKFILCVNPLCCLFSHFLFPLLFVLISLFFSSPSSVPSDIIFTFLFFFTRFNLTCDTTYAAFCTRHDQNICENRPKTSNCLRVLD